MKIGLRPSPHIEELAISLAKHGDTLTTFYDGSCDYYLCWGWPSAQEIVKCVGPVSNRIICVDCHPFALRAGDRSGSRIFQLANWGSLAAYPLWARPVPTVPTRGDIEGPVLVLGQVYTAEQARHGLVDVWHTGGYDQWVRSELALPHRKFRKHPRIWMVENSGEVQPTLAEDLAECSRVVSWNSTAAIHARLMGYSASAVEPHGWAHMSLTHLAGLVMGKDDIRSGEAWGKYREWLMER